MNRPSLRRRARIVLMTGAALALCPAAPAAAQSQGDLVQQLDALRAELSEQRALIEAQSATIQRQQQEIDALGTRIEMEQALSRMRGAGFAQGTPAGQPAQTQPAPSPALQGPTLPDRPVGEAPPPEPDLRTEARAIPEDQGVLTPAGMLVIDPQVEYVGSTNNRLVFRGIELIPGLQIGAIEASDVDRDTLVGSAAVRYGITSRLEAEVRVPYLYRRDRIEVVQQRDEGIVRTIELEADGIGDVEFGLRYQLNNLRPQEPIWIAQLRVKSNTGTNPYEIPFDEFGVATGLATGSGFWALQPGISFLLPSDPVVIFGGANYLWNIPRDIDREIGEVFVGRVDPGDAISANLGFGFALNPRFSFSLSYRHSYIFPTRTELGDSIQRSNRAQVGTFGFGMAYRFTERQTVNFGFNFGVTEDAPDVSISIRIPFDFQTSRTDP